MEIGPSDLLSGVAERAGISRPTLEKLERGSHSSSIGTLLRILGVLGLEDDYRQIASDDELGRRLQDAKLTSPRQRAPKRPKPEIGIEDDSN